MKHKGLCLIGAGGIAQAHISAVEANSDLATITAIVDISPEASSKLAKQTGAKAFDSLTAALSDLGSTFDAVVICTPPSARIEYVKAALEAGKHVLMEKPIATNIEEAETLVDLAGEYPNLICATAYCHRFEPAIVEIKKLIDTGDYGKLVRVENTFACPMPQMQDHWMSDPAISGGGSLIDTASHSLDMFQHFVGEAELVGAVLYHGWEGRGETNVSVLLKAKNGVAAGMIGSGWNEAMRFQVKLICEKASFSYDYCIANTIVKQTAGVEGEESITVDGLKGRFGGQMKAFIEKINHPETQSNLATFGDGLKTARLVQAAQALCPCG
ncbi:Gfo/Idh/MocA family protein [Poriferisphaera sp. WC338]|uniref:Gfo/Idh/MocA family protein n=1 Tax=Poriferisphaera sp. WC338 TaxID=3425129 RepID=UPI003D818E41